MRYVMRLKIALLGLVAILLTSCGPTGIDKCAGWKPIYLDEASLNGLTNRDAADILAHNDYGRVRCGW